MPADTLPELMDVKAVAALLACSTRHVIRLSAEGKMPPPVRLGHLVRWPRASLMEWIGAGCPRTDEGRAA